MSISLAETIWVCVYATGFVLSAALLWWRFGDWRMTPRTRQGRLVHIAARSALNAVTIGLLYFTIGLGLAITLIWWRETENFVWLERWGRSFVWVLNTLGALILLLLLVAVVERWKLDREVRRQLEEESRQAALSRPPWEGTK